MKKTISLIVTLFFLLFLFYPLGYTFKQAFCTNNECNLSYIFNTLSSYKILDLFSNSINIAFITSFVTSILALILSFLITYFQFPLKKIFHCLLLSPILIPPFVGALAFKQILGRFGSINLILLNLNIIDNPIDWISSFPTLGISIIQALHLYPFQYLMLVSSLKNTDYNLQEAGIIAGLKGLRLFHKITIPLISPALLGGAIFTFIGSFTDLGTPLFFEYREIIPVYLFYLINEQSNNVQGYALSLIITLLCFMLFIFIRSQSYDQNTAMTAKGFRPIQTKRISDFTLFLTYVFLCSIILLSLLPHIGIILIATADKWFFTPFPSSFTTVHFYQAFTHPISINSLKNSLILAVASTVVDIIIGVIVAYNIIRSRKKWVSYFFEGLASIPLAVPGIIIAFSYVSSFAGTPIDNRINPVILLIAAYAIRRLPFMVRSTTAGLEQASKSLEEAAAVAGLSSLRIFSKITLPIIKSHILAGAILCFAFAIIEVSDSIILALEEQFYPVSKALYVLAGRPDGPPIAAALSFLIMIIVFFAIVISSYLSKKVAMDVI